MADKVLYFPYIRVPENEWFTRVLLYWDEIGSIVPSEYIYRPEALGNYMIELLQSGLVRQVFPGDYTHKIPKFEEAFLELIDKDKVIAERRHVALRRKETSRIHIEKFGEELAHQLRERGLAQKARENRWYNVEERTADLFMAYLASVLGKTKDLQMDPITDCGESLSVFFKSPQKTLEGPALVDQLRRMVIGQTLPAPVGKVPVSELADFKSSYSDLCRRFRRRIESSLIDIANIPDMNMREERTRYLLETLKEEMDEITARMHETRWPKINLGTFCGLLASAIPGARGFATGDITSALEALPGLVAAICFAFSGTRTQTEILQSPLAYAVLAKERLSD